MTPSPLDLLVQGRYNELLALMKNAAQRGQLLTEIAGRYDAAAPANDAVGIPEVFASRKLELRANGDFAWGLLDAAQRRDFLIHHAQLLRGSGTPDAGAAQRSALQRLRGELESLYDTLKVALRDGDLDWLLPLAANLHTLLEITGDFESMRERYLTMLVAAEHLHSLQLELHARLGLCVAYSRLGDFQAAIAVGRTAVQLALRLQLPLLHAAALHLTGSALAMQGDYAEARDQLEAALHLRRELRDAHGTMSTLSNLAYVEQYSGNPAAARELLREALSLSRELGDQRAMAMYLQNLGAQAYSAGDTEKAEQLYAEAVELQRALGDPRGEAGALSGCGFAQYAARKFDAARVVHEQVLAIARQLGDRYIEHISLVVLGNIELLTGGSGARAMYEQALDLCQQMEQRQGEARSRSALALAALQEGDPAAAAAQLALGLEIFIELEEQPGIADALSYAAAVLAGSQSELAARALRAALQLAEAIGHAFDPLDLKVLRETQQLLGQSEGPAEEVTPLAATVVQGLRDLQ